MWWPHWHLDPLNPRTSRTIRLATWPASLVDRVERHPCLTDHGRVPPPRGWLDHRRRNPWGLDRWFWMAPFRPLFPTTWLPTILGSGVHQSVYRSELLAVTLALGSHCFRLQRGRHGGCCLAGTDERPPRGRVVGTPLQQKGPPQHRMSLGRWSLPKLALASREQRGRCSGQTKLLRLQLSVFFLSLFLNMFLVHISYQDIFRGCILRFSACSQSHMMVYIMLLMLLQVLFLLHCSSEISCFGVYFCFFFHVWFSVCFC